MHGFFRFRIERGHEILVHLFGDKGSKGRRQFCQRHQNGVQRRVSRRLVLRHLLAPVALAAAAHVPVGEHVAKILQGARAVGDLVCGEPLIHPRDQSVEFGQDPAVHDAQSAGFQIVFARIVPVDLGIEHEKGVGVPERAHVFSLRFGHGLLVKAGRQPGRAGSIEIPTHGVGALLIQNAPRIYDVALMLGHFHAVFIVDVP